MQSPAPHQRDRSHVVTLPGLPALAMARHRALAMFHPPLRLVPSEPMTATMTGDDWLYEISSDDENDHQGGSDISDSDGELDHGTSPHSQLPPVPRALPFLDYHR
ncbi:uncharacterized protein CLUP02_16967 [Colletotrichum lupini]|uniref:Uncharacterized protein n=1 Tax=Colletotrichum lupini TaxID=145971 RepID=A0A9Q8WQH3_9PEZI|nr:uncharacterized protein CLUP02_16967 [Colletotrichum lupini]UQC91432.1 hypothetical protein CLUP02_16967 [Colletotrichum lupini]